MQVAIAAWWVAWSVYLTGKAIQERNLFHLISAAICASTAHFLVAG